MKELLEFIKSLNHSYDSNIIITYKTRFAHRRTNKFSILGNYLDKIDFNSNEIFHLHITL